MAVNIRLHTYRGARQVEQTLPRQFSSDSVFVLDEPYLTAQLLAVGEDAVSSTPANDGGNVLRIEVPDQQSVRYEINPAGRIAPRTASDASPSLSGTTTLPWGNGYSISLLGSGDNSLDFSDPDNSMYFPLMPGL